MQRKTDATGNVAQPNYTSVTSGRNYLLSSDFNAIFGVNTAATAGYTGTGQKIAVVGRSRVNATDISRLETLSGQTVQQPNTIIPSNGVDPGAVGDNNPNSSSAGDQDEATLDINRTLGTAPGATVDLIVSGNVGAGNTTTTQALYVAMNYEVNTQMDPVMSISFGGCEANDGAPQLTYNNNLFQQGASEGISIFVSSGDSGAASCNAFSSDDSDNAAAQHQRSMLEHVCDVRGWNGVCGPVEPKRLLEPFIGQQCDQRPVDPELHSGRRVE